MSSTLYTKYRPSSFSEVIGQDHIVKTLQNQIARNKIGHAYLFSGPRGTGKTTIARLIAKELSIFPEDIYEIDAASNRRIDDIRNIKEHINTLPLKSDYKIYIIDEVHMLTKEASNALLKTLEEPPKFAIFILATTEKHKILDTIISRCQVFDFKHPNTEEIGKLLSKVCAKENCEIDDKAIPLIANYANGSFRDALSSLERVISLSEDGKITCETVSLAFGSSEQSTVISMLKHIAEGSATSALSEFLKLKDSHINHHNLVDNMLGITRHLLLSRYDNDYFNKISKELPPEIVSFIEEYKTVKGKFLNSRTLSTILATHDKTATNPSPVHIEIALLELIEQEKTLQNI